MITIGKQTTVQFSNAVLAADAPDMHWHEQLPHVQSSYTDLESLFSFALLYQDRLQHVVHLCRWCVFAVTHANAGQQYELLDPLLGSGLYQVDVALQAHTHIHYLK